MTYCCESCGFLFSRRGTVWECPSCEGLHIRSATEEERARFEALLNEEKAQSPVIITG